MGRFVLLQQLFRSQQAAAAGGQAAAAQLQLLQQQQQQQFQLQQQLAAQQAFTSGPYVINAGQEGAPYVSALIAGVPPYYGVAAPWGVYPGLVAQPAQQQAQQPRRPLTPQQAEQQVNGQGQYVIPYYDPGSLVMGGRNGTPLRLVSPGGVLAPRSYQAPAPAVPHQPAAPHQPTATPQPHQPQPHHTGRIRRHAHHTTPHTHTDPEPTLLPLDMNDTHFCRMLLSHTAAQRESTVEHIFILKKKTIF